MKTTTTLAICLLLASRLALCGDAEVRELSDNVSTLERRVAKTEETLRDVTKSLIAAGYYKPEKEEQQAERIRLANELRAEFEAMTVDQLEDLILDLEDEVAQAGRELLEARKAAPRAGSPMRPAEMTSGDRQQRKAALREQFAASRAYKAASERIQALQPRLKTVRSVWEEKVAELPARKPRRNRRRSESNLSSRR